MTVSTSTNSVSYNGNGTTSVFAYTFPILSSDWLHVTRRNANGTENTLVKGTDYFVLTGVGSPTGGNITITPTPPTGSVITIRRVVPATQLVDLTPNDPFPAETIEDSLDKLTMLASGAIEGSDRTLKLRETDVDGSGAYNAKRNRITALAQPAISTDAVNLSYLQQALANATTFGVNRVPQEYEFVGDGFEDEFTCVGIEITDPKVYLVTIEGIVQNPGQEYTIDVPNQKIRFTTPPNAGNEINVRVLGFQAQIPPGAGSGPASSATFYRGDGQWANKLIATSSPLPSPPPADSALGFGIDSNSNRLVLQLNSLDRSAVRFGINGGTETFEMGFEYTPSLSGAMQVVRGGLPASATFYKSGDISLGTSISSLYVDAEVQRVGIGGIVAPTATLHVGGDVLIDGPLSAQLNGGDIVTGIISPNRLATGIPDNTKFLRGDGTWASGVGGGSYTDANAVAAVSAALVDSSTIDFTGGLTITASVIAGSIGATQLATNAVTTAKIADANVTVAKISATGTPSSTTFLRGDGQWQVPPGSVRANDDWYLYDTVSARDEWRIGRSTFFAGVGITSEASIYVNDPAGPTWRRFLTAGCASGSSATITLAFDNLELSGNSINWNVLTNNVPPQTINTDALFTTVSGGFRIIGRPVGGGTNEVLSMTGTQVTAGLDVFTSSLKGLAPASGGGTANFLRADGTWASPSASTITVGDTATIDLTLSAGNLTASVVSGSIGTTQIATGGVASTNIANAAVTSTKIADAAVTVGKLGTNSVGSLNIIDGQVTAAKIADAGVTAAKLAANSVELAKINATGAAASRVLRINGAGTGLEWSAGGGAVDTASAFTWTAFHRWQSGNLSSGPGSAINHNAGTTVNEPALDLYRIHSDAAGHQGAALRATTIRTAGGRGNANWIYYSDRAPNADADGGFDIALSVTNQGRRIQSTFPTYQAEDGMWLSSFSPCIDFSVTPDGSGIVHAWTRGIVRAAEINYGNGWGNPAFFERRIEATNQACVGIELFPDWLPGDIGQPHLVHGGPPGSIKKFDANWAIAIGAAGWGNVTGNPRARNKIGILIDEDGISQNGYAFMVWGGSGLDYAGGTSITADIQRPAKVMKVAGRFREGIDLSSATFDRDGDGVVKTAIMMSANQNISLNAGGTDALLYWSTAGNELRIRIGGTDYRFNLTAV